jgi:hypothetical protein
MPEGLEELYDAHSTHTEQVRTTAEERTHMLELSAGRNNVHVSDHQHSTHTTIGP